ncbi:uncharacterized protein LOC126845012 [Adelges cooleyi]|uniref:uncharacterized protein LOC126845012 n=1 Tax=Adelges cooleyi TaxID=133065 RepID=UPI00217F4961|nr:uncharacterized protein LOC126845012 [Adelges cooleyi]
MTHYFPFTIRQHDDDRQQQKHMISSRIVEKVFHKYLHHPFDGDTVRECIRIDSFAMTRAEQNLLNYINQVHCDQMYDKWSFDMNRDVLLRLEDVEELFVFIKIFYDKTVFNTLRIRQQRCGFLKVNNRKFLPYCVKDNRKYIPLFCLEGNLDAVKPHSVLMTDWNLAYLKYVCQLLELPNWLFSGDSILAATLQVAKTTLPPDTVYEEYWPIVVSPPPPDLVRPPYQSTANREPLSVTQGQSTSSDNQSAVDQYFSEDTGFQLNTGHANRRRAYFSPGPYNRMLHWRRPRRSSVRLSEFDGLPSNQTSSSIRQSYEHCEHKYLVQPTTLKDKTIFCINVEPYVHSDYMVAVQDLVRQLFPNSSVKRCAFLLSFLEKPLYSGNAEQLAVMRANGRTQDIAYADELPFVKLFDLRLVLDELSRLIEQDEQELQRPPKKRQRLN